MSDLKDYIQTRKEELQARKHSLQSSLQFVDAELNEILRAERAITPQTKISKPPITGSQTIKQQILAVLKSAENPLSAFEIKTKMELLSGHRIERTTFSPQLSRLVYAGLVNNKDGMYTVTETGRTR